MTDADDMGMSVAPIQSIPPGRGTALLLQHCAWLGSVDDARPPASERLQQALGGELTRFLLGALAEHDHGVARSRWRPPDG